MSKKKTWTEIGFKGEWAQTLKKYLKKQQDDVPPGWLRIEQALRQMGFSTKHPGGHGISLLNSMVRDGVLEKKLFRIFDGSGRRITQIAHYKIVKPL